jgi:ABC-type multidrug transport system fused ATPase/permease subunit
MSQMYPAPPQDTTRVPKTIGLELSAARLPIASDATIRREFGGLLLSHRRGFLLVIIFNAIAVGAELVAPRVLGGVVQGLTEDPASVNITRAGLIVLAAIAVMTVFARITQMKASVLGESILATLRERFITRTTLLPPGVVERAGTGELLTRTTTDVDRLTWAIRDAIPEIAIALVTVFVGFAALLITSPTLALVWLLGLPISVTASRWYFRRSPQAYRAEGGSYARVNTVIAETVDAGRVLESLGLGERRVEQSDRAIHRWLSWERYTMRLRTVFFPSLEAATALPIPLMLFIGGYLAFDGRVSVAQLTASVLYAQIIMWPTNMVLLWWDELQVGIASLSRILGVYEVPDQEFAELNEPDGRHISADDVRFAYREKDVLNGIDIEIAPGSRVAIVGPSGAGKSTLGRLLAGIHAPRAGTLTIGDAQIGHLPTEQVRRHVALVTQEHHIFSGDIRDNLRLARPDATDEDIWAALHVVDASEWVRALPDGLGTKVGSGGHKVSAPQAQQIALARLVLADPHTLVLDEATSLLDPRAARHLERSLSAVLQGRTVVAIAHRLSTAHDADVIAVVDDGKITEYGSHDELVHADGPYAALWRSWRDDD